MKKSQAGGGVAVKIEHAVYQSAKMFGRHFDEKDEILSHITRQSIDVLKVGTPLFIKPVINPGQASFKADVSNEEWLLIKALKPVGFVFLRRPLTKELPVVWHSMKSFYVVLHTTTCIHTVDTGTKTWVQ